MLASWLLSTLCDDILVYLICASTSFEVCSIIEKQSATQSSIKTSSQRHMLYSQKKWQMTIKEYLFKIKNMCDVLSATVRFVSDQEQVNIILAGLPLEYDSVRVVTSANSVSLELLPEMLIDCE
ncbi:hypothetical protein Gotri_015017 [Gossypium trilobum]|uniref:Retrovirus-related Pol polyprotein from transposon TNT 1-94 n=1 Tax=Gossypium trilobum TaxID=34281 RepID=A0A7J9DYW5_9ROSI|nr:hypothetical protein [Gossypium trilobum]